MTKKKGIIICIIIIILLLGTWIRYNNRYKLSCNRTAENCFTIDGKIVDEDCYNRTHTPPLCIIGDQYLHYKRRGRLL